MQHCLPTAPNIVGCYMLRLFAYPVACWCVLFGVVAFVWTSLLTLTQKLPTTHNNMQRVCRWTQHVINIQQCWGLWASEQYCVRLHRALGNRVFRHRTNGHSIFGLQLPTFWDVHTLLGKVWNWSFIYLRAKGRNKRTALLIGRSFTLE